MSSAPSLIRPSVPLHFLPLWTLVQRLHDLFQAADVTFGLFQVLLETGL